MSDIQWTPTMDGWLGETHGSFTVEIENIDPQLDDVSIRFEFPPQESKVACERALAAVNDQKTLTCAFCGHEYAKGTPAAQHADLTAHVSVCEKHPAAALRARITELEQENEEMHEYSAKLEVERKQFIAAGELLDQMGVQKHGSLVERIMEFAEGVAAEASAPDSFCIDGSEEA